MISHYHDSPGSTQAKSGTLTQGQSSASFDSEYQPVEIAFLVRNSKYPIYLVIHKETNKVSAMKVFPLEDEVSSQFVSEARLLGLSHPNIITLYDCKPKRTLKFRNGKHCEASYILMELAPYGDFADLIMRKKFPDDEKL